MKIILRILKVLVFLALVGNTGIFSFMISRMNSDTGYNPKNIPIMQKACIEINEAARERVKNGHIYSPEDYF